MNGLGNPESQRCLWLWGKKRKPPQRIGDLVLPSILSSRESSHSNSQNAFALSPSPLPPLYPRSSMHARELAQDPARLCRLGGRFSSTWTGIGCLKGRFQRGDSLPEAERAETWLTGLSHHSIWLQAYFEMSPSFQQGLSFLSCSCVGGLSFQWWFTHPSLQRSSPTALVLSKTVTLKLIFPRGGTLSNQIIYVV